MAYIKCQAIIEAILDWRCVLKGCQAVEGQGTLAEHLNNKFCKQVNNYGHNYRVNLSESFVAHYFVKRHLCD